LQTQQDVQQGVAVLAAGQTHHDPVTLLDHVEIIDGITHVVTQALGQFVALEHGLFGLVVEHGVLFGHGVRLRN
jgi:hypothetical protein